MRLFDWLGGRQEAELSKELRFHIEEQTGEFIRQGFDPGEARRRATLKFGGSEQIKEMCRDQRSWRWVEDFLRDVAYGYRVLRKSPVFTCAAVLSLALGIGANTAIFTLIDHVMLRFLPVHEPERLVSLERSRPPYGRTSFSYPMFEHVRNGARTLDGIFAHSWMGKREIEIEGRSEEINAEVVSGSYHDVLGVHAVVGRVFSMDDDRTPGAHPVAVVSHSFWRNRLGMNPAAVGKTFRLNNTLFTIVGVTPPDFFGTHVGTYFDITFPLAMDAQVRGSESWLPKASNGWLLVMGRLQQGQTAEQADAEVQTVLRPYLEQEAARSEARSRDEILGERIKIAPAGNGFDRMREEFSEPLKVLMGLVALLLLIACANVANLLLGRSAARQREIAVRLAVGAKRGRVIRQMITEGLLLSVLGGAVGLLFAYWFSDGLVTFLSNGGPRIAIDVSPDARVLLFALGVTIVSCLLFSLAPAVQGTRNALQESLRQTSATSRWRLGKALIAAQIAVVIVLLTGAAIFCRTLMNLYKLDAGFERDGVVMVTLNTSKTKYSDTESLEVRRRLMDQLTGIPGVKAAATVAMPPISGGGWDGELTVRGKSEPVLTHLNEVSVGYFNVMRTPVLAGRVCEERDSLKESRGVFIINEEFARRQFGNASPVGQYLYGRGTDEGLEIIGVVKNSKYRDLRHDFPQTAYFCADQMQDKRDWDTYLLRTDRGVGEMAGAVNMVLKRIDSNLRVRWITTLNDHISQSLLRERLMAVLALCFGSVALLLSAVGIYGVMAFQAQRRTKEVGIRIALGAKPGEVIRMLLRDAAWMIVSGGLAGIAAAAVLARTTENFVYGFKPTDPMTFAAALALLVLVALIAAYWPGRRAAGANPANVLRYE